MQLKEDKEKLTGLNSKMNSIGGHLSKGKQLCDVFISYVKYCIGLDTCMAKICNDNN